MIQINKAREYSICQQIVQRLEGSTLVIVSVILVSVEPEVERLRELISCPCDVISIF
jgi:hypothetical protein